MSKKNIDLANKRKHEIDKDNVNINQKNSPILIENGVIKLFLLERIS